MVEVNSLPRILCVPRGDKSFARFNRIKAPYKEETQFIVPRGCLMRCSYQLRLIQSRRRERKRNAMASCAIGTIQTRKKTLERSRLTREEIMDENQAVEQTRNESDPLVGNILMNDLIHISVTSIPFKLITRERLVAIFLYIRLTRIAPLFRPHITFPPW